MGWTDLMVHSFIYNYLVSISVNPEPIPGTQGRRQKYTMHSQGTPKHKGHQQITGYDAHTHSHLVYVFGKWKKTCNPQTIYTACCFTMINIQIVKLCY